MTKVFRLTEIDCPVCAGKVQDNIAKIQGVKSARVDFLVLKLTIEADEKDFPSIMKQAEKAVKKVEPDCDIEDWD